MPGDALYTADEMRAAEARYPGYPDTVPELMERAGGRAAEVALERFPDARRWTLVCGGGANGGDGRVMARVLAEAGREPLVVDAKAGERDLGDPDVIVDALFGTGFAGEPRPEAAALIEAVNGAGVPVFAIDLPSGVDASTGEVAGAVVEATVTVTFHGPKVGLAVAPGRFHAGEVHVADIGLGGETGSVVGLADDARPEDRTPGAGSVAGKADDARPRDQIPGAPGGDTASRLVTAAILDEVPRRGSRDNKYTAGHVLVVGGSRGLTGAPSLAAMAALRADAGYVTVAAPSSTLPVFEQRLLEAVKRPLPDAGGEVAADAVDVVLELAAKAHAIALGPGLGRGPGAKELVRRVLAESELPIVVDADALHELEPAAWPGPRVLTPHEGELGRLLGRPSAEIAAHRLASVQEAAERFGCVVLLKGEDTLVAAPGTSGALVVALGVPSLATAGTGDVLTGIAAAFLAKGLAPRRATAAAAAAQQLAAANAPHRAGLVASDVVDLLPTALS